MSDHKRQTHQQTLAEDLQDKLLKHFKEKLEEGTISAGEVSTLTKLLTDQGWTFDPNDLPDDLRTKLTESIDPESLPSPADYGLPEAEA